MSTVFCAGSIARMKEQKWGRLVAITSYTVKQPVDGMLLSIRFAPGLPVLYARWRTSTLRMDYRQQRVSGLHSDRPDRRIGENDG
jgi:hypothetical protein